MDRTDVGRKMGDLRKSRGISMREVARRMKVSTPYVWDLESGKRNWRPELVKQYEKACK